MSQIINELATIEVSNEVLQQLDLGGIYKSFSKNYQKLDDLKNFRSDYEKKNRLMRWWHNDKLRDAQLDSAEVQAEFSKTIGQLMMISIMQSKKLAEQQTQLNEQQNKLRTQADGIAEHAGELQKQHQVLAEQSAKQETLVREYFALKGLTEDGAQKLIDIAKDIKSTKEGMLQDFTARTKDIEVLFGDVMSQMTSLSAQVNDQIHQSAEQVQSEIAALRQETQEELAANGSALRNQLEAAQLAMSQNMAKLEQGQHEVETNLLAKHAALESSLFGVSAKLEKQATMHRERFGLIENELGGQVALTTDVASDLSKAKMELASFIQQQQILQQALGRYQNEISGRLKRLGYVAVGLSIAVLGMLGGMTHLLGWI